MLRFLLYVYRSDIPPSNSRPSDFIFEIAPHHARMAVEWWMADNSAGYFAKGTPQECLHNPGLFHKDGGWVKDAYPCEGLVLVTPPRHMKSMFGTAVTVLRIDQNNREQAAICHAVQDKAAENMRFVSAAFKGRGHRDGNEIGRRNLALFPARLDRSDNNDSNMRLRCSPPTRDPTLRGRGVMSGIGGGNISFLWGDDIVEQEASSQPNTRNITSEKWMGEWMQRRQGRAKMLNTSTLWHPDDTVARLVELARKYAKGDDSGIPLRVCIMPAGGPVARTLADGSTVRPFEPLWKSSRPAVGDVPWSSAWLRSRYNILGPYKYACQFECNPIPDNQKLLRRLKIVPVACAAGQTPPPEVARQIAEHQEFIKTAQMHLSVDPSATKKENAEIRRADKTGMVMVGSGVLIRRTEQLVEHVGTCVRVLDSAEFYASPSEIVSAIRDYAKSGRRIDKVHVELVGFSVALLEMIENSFSLPSSAMYGHRTRNLSKRDRLKAVVPMLEDIMADEGFSGAKVEIAGVWDNGVVYPTSRLAPLVEQLLNFGFTKHDHLVDALTQVLAFLSPSVELGLGEVTQAIAQSDEPESETLIRLRQDLDAYAQMSNKPGRVTDPVLDDASFYEIAPGIPAGLTG